MNSSFEAIVVQGVNAEEIKADTIQAGEGIIGALAQQGKAEFINDTNIDSRAVHIPGTPQQAEERLMVAPLLTGERVSGMMAVWREGSDPFMQADLEFLEELSLQAAIAIKNANLFDETEQHAAELAIINSVQEGLARKLDFQEIIDLVGEKIGEIFAADTVSVGMYDTGRDWVFNTYYVDRGQKITIAEGPAPRPSLTTMVIDDLKPLLIGTVEESEKLGALRIPREGERTDQNKSYLGVPILANEKVIGAVSVQSYKQNAFNQNDLRLLQTLANSMSVALENARLFDETQRLLKETEQRAAELAIINSVQQGLASKLDFQAIIDLVGDQIRDIFDTQAINISQYDAATNLFSSLYIMERGVRHSYAPMPPGPIYRRIIDTHESLLFRTAAEFNTIGAVIVPGTTSSQSGIYVPLIQGRELMGVVALENLDHENAFTESDLRLLTTLANSMSVALENARLFDETQRLLKETEQRAAELAIINSVQEGLASRLEIQAIYELVGDKIRDVFDAQVVTISTFDTEKQQSILWYGIEKGERFYDHPSPLTAGHHRFIQARQPLLINQDWVRSMHEFGYRVNVVSGTASPKSTLFVPLIVNNEVKGSVSLQNVDREHAFGDSDIRLLTTLASSMSVALENARLFDETQRLLKETEQARRRIGYHQHS